MATFTRSEARKKRHYRVRAKVSGTLERPRLNIFKSNKSLYAQLIDDQSHNTIIGLSSLSLKDLKSTKDINAAIALGSEIAKLALTKNITKVVFDRGGYLYHGKIKAFAQAARDAGLQF